MSKHARRPIVIGTRPNSSALLQVSSAMRKAPALPRARSNAIVARARRIFHAYSRYSSAMQDTSSLVRQHKTIKRYLDTLGPHKVIFMDDAGHTAANADRPKLQELLDLVRKRQVTDVVVEDFDRWSREIVDSVIIYKLLADFNVAFHSASEERILAKEDILMFAARSERDRLRRRNLAMSGMDALMEAGGTPKGAYGYKSSGIPGFPVVEEEQARVIRKIAGLFASGHTGEEVSRILEAQQILSPSGKTKWSPSTLINLIGRPMLIGLPELRVHTLVKSPDGKVRTVRQPREKVKEGYNPAFRILSDAVFHAANLAIRQRAPGWKIRHVAPGAYPMLSGPVSCDCGVPNQRFRRERAGKLVRYTCDRKEACKGPSRTLNAGPVDKVIIDVVEELMAAAIGNIDFKAECVRRRGEAERDRLARRERIEGELAARDRMADRALEAEVRKGRDDPRLNALQERLEREIAELHVALEAVSTPIAPVSDTESVVKTLAAMKGRLPLRSSSEAEANFAMAMRCIVPAVRIERVGEPFGRARLAVSVDIDAPFSPLPDPTRAAASEVVTRALPPSGYQDVPRLVRIHSEREAASGIYALTDAQWSLVGPLLPNVAAGDSAGISLRSVADAAVFCMSTSVAISRPPDFFGPQDRVYALLLRLAYHGGVETLVATLGADDPAWAASVEPDRLRRLKRRCNKNDRAFILSAEAAQTGRHDLTDVQWAASAKCVHPAVAGLLPEAAVDPRRVIDACLNVLRTGVKFSRLPALYGDRRRTRAAIVRLVYTGSWDRLVEAWRLEHPELVEGLRLDRMLKCPVRSIPAGWSAENDANDVGDVAASRTPVQYREEE